VRIPWWKPEKELKPATGRAYVDVLGRSTGLERRPLKAGEFVELACAGLGVAADSLSGPYKDRKTTRMRRMVATVGIEGWGQHAGVLGGELGKHPDVVSRWARAGAETKLTDPKFAEAIDQLDLFLAGSRRPK